MPTSVTVSAMRKVSKCLVESYGPLGFRRETPHLWREVGDVIHVMNFQASQWGTVSEGSFTINLAVTNRCLYSKWTGRPFPSNPGAAVWPVHCRIGRLLGKLDRWWSIDEDSDVLALAESIIDEYRAPTLDFFHLFSSLDALEVALQRVKAWGDVPGIYETQAPLICAIIRSMKGDRDSSERLLAGALEDSLGKPFEKTVRSIASRLDSHVA